MSRIVVAIGTRPDVIKMNPVIDALREEGFDPEIVWSGQGKDLNEATGGFPVDAHCLNVDWPSAAYGISKVIARFSHYLRASGRTFTYDYDWENPEEGHEVVEGAERVPVDCVLVHGDDATAYACAVAAFLEEVPVAHVEAGLRTYEAEPFPEEALRRMIGAVATYHFCPDDTAKHNIWRECNPTAGIPMLTYTVGNTVNDTLPAKPFRILATLHRRENWGERILSALNVLSTFSGKCALSVVRHPNWGIHMAVADLPDLEYISPVGRADFIDQIVGADLIVTDSGGLQEECALLGKPCLVVRTSTERTALLGQGVVTLIHPDRPEDLAQAIKAEYNKRYVYGVPGTVSKKIAKILKEELSGSA